MPRKWSPGFSDQKGILADLPVFGGIIAAGTTVPTDGATGYSKGCIFLDLDASANAMIFVNEGSNTSSDFNNIVTSSSATTTAFTQRVTTTDGVTSGTARVVGGLAYSQTAASTAITGSTTAEQLFDQSYTIPANTLKAGTVVKYRAQGIATTTQSTDGVQYKLYIGGSGGTALITAATTDAADAHTFQMEGTVVCRTAGTTGTIVGTATYKVSSAEGTMTVKDDILASTTFNTQQNNALVVTATWNVANATNSCRLDILTVEIY